MINYIVLFCSLQSLTLTLTLTLLIEFSKVTLTDCQFHLIQFIASMACLYQAESIIKC